MKQNILITDVTAMSGHYVCVAGSNEKQQNIRPDLKHVRISIPRLYSGSNVFIRPRAIVELQLTPKPYREPPHLEDHIWHEPETMQLITLLDEQEWFNRLEKMTVPTPEQAFHARLHDNKYVKHGEGKASLATIRCASIDNFSYEINPFESGKYKYRLSFRDKVGNEFDDISVTDFTLRRYADYLRIKEKKSLTEISDLIYRHFEAAEIIWLRLGLARKMRSPREMIRELWCYLQVNGIYTSPDYLDGKCFADFE